MVWFLQRFDDAHKLLFKTRERKKFQEEAVVSFDNLFPEEFAVFYFQLAVPFAGNWKT